MISESTWICIFYGKVHTFIIGPYMQPCFISGRDLLLSCDVSLAHGMQWKLSVSWYTKKTVSWSLV